MITPSLIQLRHTFRLKVYLFLILPLIEHFRDGRISIFTKRILYMCRELYLVLVLSQTLTRKSIK